jgi:choice-of-anchor C domain-containing protein
VFIVAEPFAMKFLFLALALSAAAGSAGAATVQNGGFEQPGSFAGSFQTIGAGSAALPGWSISGTSVDLIYAYWQPAGDKYSLDLSGNAPSTISQTISDLMIDQRYTLSFMLAGNPAGGPGVKSVRVSIGGDMQTFTFDTNGKSLAAMGWIGKSLDFTARETSLVLSFTALDGGAYGPALDDIAISPIPLPAGAPLLLAGLGALAVMRRRTRQRSGA